MIANHSRLKEWQLCRRKDYYDHHLCLGSPLKAEPLITGSAVHAGFASLLAGESLSTALSAGDEVYSTELAETFLLPEERETYENKKAFARKAIECYAKQLPGEKFQVLHPEVKFRIPLSNTEHFCYFFYQFLQPNGSLDDFKLARTCYLLGDPDRNMELDQCWQPHYFQGKTDALVVAQGMIWLLEHKTSSDYKQSFWDNFLLNQQVTRYIYGIWKSIGIRPSGAIVNKIQKPNTRQSLSSVKVESEAFIRSDDDLSNCEAELVEAMNLYEEATIQRHIGKNSEACISWNRKCLYHSLCSDHITDIKDVDKHQFPTKKLDYINEAYYEVLGLPLPTTVNEETN